MPHTATITPAMHDCAELCQECHGACTELVGHCLELGGPHAESRHIGLLLDCAQICAVAGDFMHRGSPSHGSICAVCAEMCDFCAEDCERIGPDDRDMTRCAETCRRCAESCRTMSGGE